MWQLKTVVFLHWCLICSVLLIKVVYIRMFIAISFQCMYLDIIFQIYCDIFLWIFGSSVIAKTTVTFCSASDNRLIIYLNQKASVIPVLIVTNHILLHLTTLCYKFDQRRLNKSFCCKFFSIISALFFQSCLFIDCHILYQIFSLLMSAKNASTFFSASDNIASWNALTILALYVMNFIYK